MLGSFTIRGRGHARIRMNQEGGYNGMRKQSRYTSRATVHVLRLEGGAKDMSKLNNEA